MEPPPRQADWLWPCSRVLDGDLESKLTSVACQGPGTSGWGADVTPAVRPSLHPVIPVPSLSPGGSCRGSVPQEGPCWPGRVVLVFWGKATPGWSPSTPRPLPAPGLASLPRSCGLKGMAGGVDRVKTGQSPEQLSRGPGAAGSGRAELPPPPRRAAGTGPGDTANTPHRSPGTGREAAPGP